ncbi:hypothetical protein [Ornithinimicrobium cerasi]|uniref:hypothetical protein n=1 Tax=Ornithinimicrobium cerasi TaxID=2248773 RepID=UPI000BE2CC6F|nr:hypothetical protein [Ornithinimicrobium cerasi]
MMLEFWPDYGAGPLWTEDGKPADLGALELPSDLVEQLKTWNAQYAEEKLPIEGVGDHAWLDEGARLLGRTRDVLGPRVAVVVTEPWWEPPPI